MSPRLRPLPGRLLILKLAKRHPRLLCVCTLVEHELLYGFGLMPGIRAEAMTRRCLLKVLPRLPLGNAEARRAAIAARNARPFGHTDRGPYDTVATALEHGPS